MRFREFSGEWEKNKLSEYAEFLQGLTYTPDQVSDNTGCLVLRSSNIKNSLLAFDDNVYVKMNIPKRIKTLENDVLMCVRNGSKSLVGKNALITKNYIGLAWGAFMNILRPIDKTVFLFHFLNTESFKRQIKIDINTSTVNQITLQMLNSCNIYLPDVDERLKISHFLNLINNRIETQMKIIEEIKSLKNSIVMKIFGDKSKFLNKWSKTKLSDILKERKQYAQKGSKYTHVTLSKEGVVDKTDRYNRDFLVKDEEKEYKVTKLNDICYNPANLKFGVICLNKYGDAIFSPIYVTYEINQNYSPSFIELALTNSTFIGHIRKYEQGTVYERMAVSSEDFLKGTIIAPPFEDQNNIVKAFNKIDNKLEIEKNILDKLKLQKNYLLNNMFV